MGLDICGIKHVQHISDTVLHRRTEEELHIEWILSTKGICGRVLIDTLNQPSVDILMSTVYKRPTIN